MSSSVLYWLVPTPFFGSSGKHIQIRTSIYPLYVFPNVTRWRSGSFRDACGP